MLNISTKVNVINQRFAVKYSFKTLDIELPTYSQLNKTQAYCYEAYKVPLRIKDSWGRTREVTFVCYRIGNISSNVTIGMLGLKKARILINYKVKVQRQKLDSLSLLL